MTLIRQSYLVTLGFKISLDFRFKIVGMGINSDPKFLVRICAMA
jgi:hypothetical protein